MRVILLGLVLACAGCAQTQYRPVVDNGVSRGNYEDDVWDCQQLANQRPASATTAGGATVGAVLGTLFGLAVGLDGSDLAEMAAWGAVGGGVNGAFYGTYEQQAIVTRCMEGRGYYVIAE